MDSVIAILATIIIVTLGYRFYAKKIDQEVMQASAGRATPATMYNDGVDFMPANRSVLFGYQFKSIAALGPITGPIIGLQFGWLPAIGWLIVGVFFIGWVQDYAAALLAMRNEGMTMGGLSYKLISPRARTLLLSFLYIYLLLIMAAFGAIIAPLLSNPKVPVGFLIIVLAGVLAGQMTYRWKQDLLLTTVVTVAIALIGAWVGTLPIFSDPQTGIIPAINNAVGTPNDKGVYMLFDRPLPYGPLPWSTAFWAIVLVAFCYLGSVLPIWRFAQPVNYTSFWFVALGIVASILGIILATFGISLSGTVPATTFAIPLFTTAFQPHLGPIWPILFVTIACGAISGWHSLVSTSGTARQLEKETDVLPVTAGAMYTEAVLAVLAVITGATLIATTAADGTTTAIYDAAQNYKLIPGAAGVFAGGMSRFMNVLGLDVGVGLAIGSIFLVVMATTVMQLVLRFMRVASAELLGDRMPAFKNPHFGSLVAIALTLFLILVGFWQWLWVMFGSSNQLFAGLALLLITIWLAQQGRRYNWAFIPALFMCATTIAALLYVSIYNHLYVGILTADPAPATPVLIGNLFSFVLGMYMAISAVILFLDALKAFGGARQTGAAPAAAAGD